MNSDSGYVQSIKRMVIYLQTHSKSLYHLSNAEYMVTNNTFNSESQKWDEILP